MSGQNTTKKCQATNLLIQFEGYSKSIKTEAVFTKTDRYNEWNLNFLQIISLGNQHTYSSEFSTARSTSETLLLICYEAAPLSFLECPPSYPP